MLQYKYCFYNIVNEHVSCEFEWLIVITMNNLCKLRDTLLAVVQLLVAELVTLP